MLGVERTAERRALERKRVAAIVSVSMCVVGIEWYCGLGGVVDRKKSSVSIGSDEAQKLAHPGDVILAQDIGFDLPKRNTVSGLS